MNHPSIIDLVSDLAPDRPLHELTIIKKDGKTFARMLFELRPEAEKTQPSHIRVAGRERPLLEARSVPRSTAEEEKS